MFFHLLDFVFFFKKLCESNTFKIQTTNMTFLAKTRVLNQITEHFHLIIIDEILLHGSLAKAWLTA